MSAPQRLREPKDVTDRNQMLCELRLRARLLDAVDAAVIATDLEGTVEFWNGGAQRLHGWSPDEVLGRPITEITVAPEDAGFAARVIAEIHERGLWDGDFPLRRKDGSSFPALVRTQRFDDEQGRPLGMIAVSVDITDRLAIEEELRTARDFLTAVTDNIGEGLVVIDGAGSVTYANEVAERMLGNNGHELRAACITDLFDIENTDAPALLSRLQPERDVARIDDEYALRADGRRLAVDVTSSPMPECKTPHWALVISDDTERRARIDRLEHELASMGWVGRVREALRDDSLLLYAQPIVDLRTGRTVHSELLLRLRSEDGGVIPAQRFLAAAEEHGLIGEIDRWVVEQALTFAQAGLSPAINLSGTTVADSETVNWITQRIHAAGVDPQALVFEITETAVCSDPEAARHLVDRLSALGCKVALDDFGTGYSGFTYLKQLDVALLKIDMEFVRDLTNNPASRHVVTAIVDLARSFGLCTIAEGVENEQTLHALGVLGVDFAQGFHLGKPAPIAATFQGGLDIAA